MILLNPGSQDFNALTLACTCVQCGANVRWIKPEDPVGYSSRERRLVIQCTRAICAWAGTVTVEVSDLNAPAAAKLKLGAA